MSPETPGIAPIRFDSLPPSEDLEDLFEWLAGETSLLFSEGSHGKASVGSVRWTGGLQDGKRAFSGSFRVTPLGADGKPRGAKIAFRGYGEAHVFEGGCSLDWGVAEPEG